MRALGKNIGFVLIALTIVFAGGAYAIAQVDKSPTSESVGFAMGHVTVQLIDEDGNVKAYRQTDNQLVEEGMGVLCGQLFTGVTGCTNTGGAMSHMQIGTSGAATSSVPTAVLTDIGACARDAFDSAAGVVSTVATLAQVVVTVKSTFAGSGGCVGDVAEVGMHNDPTKATGEMLGRNTFTPVTVGASDSLEITWDITYKDS